MNPLYPSDLEVYTAVEISKLPAQQLMALQAHLRADEDQLKARKERLQEALNLRFGTSRGHGTFWHTTSPGLSVKVEVPKVVEWDQPKMKSLWRDIATKWHGDPDEYIDTRYFVPENRYKAWPSGLKQEFDAARTVKVGKPKFTFLPTRG
jgi:hypothetical protein